MPGCSAAEPRVPSALPGTRRRPPSCRVIRRVTEPQAAHSRLLLPAYCSPTRPCPGDPPAASPWGPGSQCESGEEPCPPQPGLLAAPDSGRPLQPLPGSGSASVELHAHQPSPAQRVSYMLGTEFRRRSSRLTYLVTSYCLFFLKVSSTCKASNLKSSVSPGKVSHPYLDPGRECRFSLAERAFQTFPF